MVWTLTQVALGGALGSLARFAVQAGGVRLFGPGLPLGTLAVNLLGCVAMGMLFVWLTEKGMMRAAPFLMAGLLGGFTTFSAFALDALVLWERGQAGLAGAYVLATVAGTLSAVALGAWLARGWLA
jgi:CrcB protein